MNILEWLVSRYLTRRDIAWRGACGHLRSPDVLFSSECPTCKEGTDMRKIKSTENVRPGMVVLTGTTYYRVVTVGPRHFCGRIWNEDRKEWAGIRTVPLPSPTQEAYVVENAAALFPLS